LAANAAESLTNAVAVAGGGDLNGENNSATDAVTVTPVSGPGIESWRQLHFGSSENSGAGADTNVVTADGLANLMKYAMGLVPTEEATAAEQPRLSGFPPLSLTFRRAREASDVIVEVQATDSLMGSWTNIWSSATNSFGGGTNDFETLTVEDTVPVEDAPAGRFLRLNVTRP
jgi:hypothetical protein